MRSAPLRLSVLACTITLLLHIALATVLARANIDATIKSLTKTELSDLGALYKDLHQAPELSFEEKATSKRVAAELRKSGFEVTENVGGFGVVAVLKNGTGPTVMIRTDMDALPITEETGASYASKVKTTVVGGQAAGVMHACGHDVHMAGIVGTARVLAQLRDHWQGTLMVIAQPAEERGAGASAMLADGLFKRFPRPDYALAHHVDPSMQSGTVSWVAGYITANVDSVDILVRGIGGHGAYPEKSKDPVVIAAQIVLALQTIVSREVRPIDPAVVTVGSIHGGTKHNIIPNEVKLQLTVRSYSENVRTQVLDAIKRIAEGVGRTAGLPEKLLPEVSLAKKEYTPAGYNDPELVHRTVAVWKRVLGADKIFEGEPSMGGEDFGRYAGENEGVKGFLFRIGSISAQRMRQAKRDPLPALHSSKFLPDYEKTIETGVVALSLAVVELMRKE